MSRPNLSDRLRRSRALATCLGRRRYLVRPLDLTRGRLNDEAQAWFDYLKRPFDQPDDDYDSQALLAEFLDKPCRYLQTPCCNFLRSIGRNFGWFEIDERAQVLGTSVYMHIRFFDVLYSTCSLFENRTDGFNVATDADGNYCRRRYSPTYHAEDYCYG